MGGAVSQKLSLGEDSYPLRGAVLMSILEVRFIRIAVYLSKLKNYTPAL
jgi:hypothetical protein